MGKILGLIYNTYMYIYIMLILPGLKKHGTRSQRLLSIHNETEKLREARN